MDESFLRLKGKKICDQNTKKCFGRLSDILVKKGTNKLLGIISKNDSFVYKQRLFRIKDIVSADETTIYVAGFGERFVKIVPENNFQSCENDIYKRKTILPDGTDSGIVQNIKFDFEIGTLTGFELGFSLAEDLLKGRKICRTRNTISFSDGKILLEEKPQECVYRKKFLF